MTDLGWDESVRDPRPVVDVPTPTTGTVWGRSPSSELSQRRNHGTFLRPDYLVLKD